jgi:hypothetical protein
VILLALSPIYASYALAAGAAPYDPKMMLKLLMFAYATAVTSSRELERRCFVDVRTGRWEREQCLLRPFRFPPSRLSHFEGSRRGRLALRRHTLLR